MAKKIGPIPSFLNKISNNWGLSFIFTKIWGITFHPSRGLNSLASSIQNVLTKYDDINDFRALGKYLDEDFDPELYDYDKLADGENDAFAEGKEYRAQSKKILLGKHCAQLKLGERYNYGVA